MTVLVTNAMHSTVHALSQYNLVPDDPVYVCRWFLGHTTRSLIDKAQKIEGTSFPLDPVMWLHFHQLRGARF